MKRPLALALALLLAASWTTAIAAECEYPKRKPIKIAGALCGRVVLHSLTEPFEYDGDVIVARVDATDGGVTARVTADSKGNFKFGPIPKGTYVLHADAFPRAYPIVVVTKTGASCGRHLFVLAHVSSECANFVETKLPRWARQ